MSAEKPMKLDSGTGALKSWESANDFFQVRVSGEKYNEQNNLDKHFGCL